MDIKKLNLKEFNQVLIRCASTNLPYLDPVRVRQMAESGRVRDDEFAYICAIENNGICGVIEIQRNAFSGKLSLNYVSVSRLNAGISKQLLAGLCDHLSNIGYDQVLDVAAFSHMGKKYLMDNLNAAMASQGIQWRSDDGFEGTARHQTRRMA